MSYNTKQLALAYPERSKEGLVELMLLDKALALKSAGKIFNNPKLTLERKKAIVKEIFSKDLPAGEAGFSKNSINFINFLLEENCLKDFSKILSEYKKILRTEKIALSGNISSASPISPEEIVQAEKDLEAKMSVPVVLESKTNPELLGGIILEVDGLVYNNSYRYKLNKLKI